VTLFSGQAQGRLADQSRCWLLKLFHLSILLYLCYGHCASIPIFYVVLVVSLSPIIFISCEDFMGVKLWSRSSAYYGIRSLENFVLLNLMINCFQPRWRFWLVLMSRAGPICILVFWRWINPLSMLFSLTVWCEMFEPWGAWWRLFVSFSCRRSVRKDFVGFSSKGLQWYYGKYFVV